MFTRLAAAGAEIVVNDVLPPDRIGLFPEGRRVWRPDKLGRATRRCAQQRSRCGNSRIPSYTKVVVADDVVNFGTVNHDAWALYRNSIF